MIGLLTLRLKLLLSFKTGLYLKSVSSISLIWLCSLLLSSWSLHVFSFKDVPWFLPMRLLRLLLPSLPDESNLL